THRATYCELKYKLRRIQLCLHSRGEGLAKVNFCILYGVYFILLMSSKLKTKQFYPDSSDSSDEDEGPDVSTKSKSLLGNFDQESDTDTSDSSDDNDSKGGDESRSEDEFSSEEKDPSQMTMEELLKLQEEIGTKAFKVKYLKSDKKNKNEVKTFKRANKNRPREVPMMRKAAPRMNFLEPEKKIGKKISRDPRFDDLSGTLNMKTWQKKYGFIVEKRKKEKELLKQELKKEKDPEQKEKLKSIVQRMENQERERAKREREENVLQVERDGQIENLKEGKKPRFMTKSEKKLLLKAAHFEQLKKENRVDKYMEKKEKGKRAKEIRGNIS
ncbi:unnamed protein product, partial [Meganyctiphanes norvegica]